MSHTILANLKVSSSDPP